MSDNYKSRKILRLKKWNYGFQGKYFITMITKNREHFFGEIINGKMVPNELGKQVESEWRRTPHIRKDMNLELDEFQLMPNHFHAIIRIMSNEYNWWQSLKLSSDLAANKQYYNPQLMHQSEDRKFGPQRKNLSSIVRGFKSAVTTSARKMGLYNFNWHKSFHDHLISNDHEYFRIATYIRNNPKKWSEDRFNEKIK